MIPGLPNIPPISAGPSAAYGAPTNANSSVYVEGYKKFDWEMFAVGAGMVAIAWLLTKKK